MEMANIIDVGMTSGDLALYCPARSDPGCYGNVVPVFRDVQAGNMAAVAGAGYAKNLTTRYFLQGAGVLI